LAEKVTGIGSVTSASIVGIAHDTLHANLIGGFVGIDVSLELEFNIIKNFNKINLDVYLHDCDGSDSGIRKWIFVSKGSGSGAALREANFKGIHQAGNELDQLKIKNNKKKQN
jgi:hypothetical protein